MQNLKIHCSKFQLMLFGLLAILCLFNSCTRTVQNEKDRLALLESITRDRTAHYTTSAALLLEDALDSFISVSNAQVKVSSLEERMKFFDRNFDGAVYSKWDYVQEPIVRISNDGSMAWVISKVEVRRTKIDANGVTKPEGFIYAGIMTYKKVDDQWKKEANVSTFEPLPGSVLR